MAVFGKLGKGISRLPAHPKADEDVCVLSMLLTMRHTPGSPREERAPPHAPAWLARGLLLPRHVSQHPNRPSRQTS